MSDQAERERMVERIRKLMLHKDGATEAEINNYLRHARKLMDQFDITEHEVLVSEKPEAARNAAYESILEEEVYSRAGSIDHYDRDLARAVTRLCDCSYYTTSRLAKDEHGNFKRGRTGNLQERDVLIFFGLPRDVEVAKHMYKELLVTMRAMGRFRLGGYTKEFPSYCMGFASMVAIRVGDLKHEKAKETSKASNTSTAIVLVKTDLVKRYKTEKLQLVPRRSRNVNVDGAIFATGQSDGAKVSLGTNGLGNRPAPKPKELR